MLSINKTISYIERSNIEYRNKAFEKFELRGYQYSYLIQICRFPGISQEELTKQTYLDKSNVARNLIKLERLEYITRIPNPEDHRFFLIHPTKKATLVYPEIMDVLRKQRQRMLAGFSVEEQELLVSLLARLQETIQQDYKDMIPTTATKDTGGNL